MNDCENRNNNEETEELADAGKKADCKKGAAEEAARADISNENRCENTAENACGKDGCGKACDKNSDAEAPAKEEKGHCRRELQKAREEIEKLKAQSDELTRKWYAVSAEYENYRRRTQNQAAQKYAEGRSDVISSLFPIGDNLERALAACADENTRQGIEMVLKSYKKLLESEGVESLDPLGQPFDSAVAEAIMAVPAENGEEPGVVRQVYVKGYKRGEKVLRYAQVIVTQ